MNLLGGNPEAFGDGTQFLLILVITALASLVLGLGLPTTANYIVMATLTAPIIFNLGEQFGFGMPLLAAHLFVFFFGILADDTPPVGLAAYAAAAIAQGRPHQDRDSGIHLRHANRHSTVHVHLQYQAVAVRRHQSSSTGPGCS